MEYRKEKSAIYLRVDKGEEVIETIKKVCEKERIEAGYFQGIGACGRAVLATWIPEKEDFIHHTITGMLEMISLSGNISTDQNGQPFSHSHAVFSYLKDNGEVAIAAGHLEEAEISYTGEIILTPADEKIGRMFDQNAGIDVWKLS
jgi:predicted DNA-binding protein with PD1-like motif